MLSDFSIRNEGNKAIIELEENVEFGKMENNSIFPVLISSFIDVDIDVANGGLFKKRVYLQDLSRDWKFNSLFIFYI